MNEAIERGQEEEIDDTLSEFAKRVVDGERTADLFGVDDGFIGAVLHKAHQFYSGKSYEKAETLLRGATVLDNQQAYAHLLLGDVLLQRAAFKEATRVLERARRLEPENPLTMAKLGEAYVRVGRRQDAAPLLKKAVDQFEEGTPNHKRASALLGVAGEQPIAEELSS